jgi:DNA-binding response OmpR family regulator
MHGNDKRTILVIDNDDQLTLALTKRLGSHGFRCITAASGAQGLAAFNNASVDLIVSDLNMPGGDGVDLAESIRRTSDVPIIFVTGFRDDFKRRLRLVKNVTTLRKPFNSQELVDLIASALGEPASASLLVEHTSEEL